MNKPTILIVEDDDDLGELLGIKLKIADLNTVVARSGKEASIYLEENEQSIDLVLSDLMMPDMDGVGLIEWMKLHLKQPIPIVFLTATQDSSILQELKNAGATDVLIKGGALFEHNNLSEILRGYTTQR